MKTKIANLLKCSRILNSIYHFIGSFLIRILGVFIKTDSRLILFNCFGGKKYDDSPKAIYEKMKNDARFSDYKVVWAFSDPTKFEVEGAQIIKSDTLKYFITALKARCWITNSAIERGLSFKKKKTLYVNTWHGTPIKLMGTDIKGNVSIRSKPRNYDIQTAQSEYEADIFMRIYKMSQKNFLICGLPRNDELVKNNNIAINQKIRESLSIPLEKKVVLYAPTFREYERNGSLACVLDVPIDFAKWKSVLGDDYVILLRAHYEVVDLLCQNMDSSFVIDVSLYPSLNELMIASDALVSDYSSIIFDYSILSKPIILYTYDYDTYNAKRGMYFDVRNELPGGSISEDELLDCIKNEIRNPSISMIEKFREKYVTKYGNATETLLEEIYNRLHR